MPRVSAVHAGDDLDQGGLAGVVLADQGGMDPVIYQSGPGLGGGRGPVRA